MVKISIYRLIWPLIPLAHTISLVCCVSLIHTWTNKQTMYINPLIPEHKLTLKHSASLQVQFHSHQPAHAHTTSHTAYQKVCGWWFPHRPAVTVSQGDRACTHSHTDITGTDGHILHALISC